MFGFTSIVKLKPNVWSGTFSCALEGGMCLKVLSWTRMTNYLMHSHTHVHIRTYTTAQALMHSPPPPHASSQSREKINSLLEKNCNFLHRWRLNLNLGGVVISLLLLLKTWSGFCLNPKLYLIKTPKEC